MKSLDLETFWKWLPAFRVVAERESLQAAARLLGLSPSSISRTIRLLETELGASLFTRDGGRLQLTVAGRDFLEHVRRAMRIVDDGATIVRGAKATGPFRLCLPRSLVGLLAIPMIARARRSEPTFDCQITHEGDERAVAAGEIDLVVATRPPLGARHVEVLALGTIGVGIHCGREHPLYGKERLAFDDVLAHSFVGTSADPLEHGAWPPELVRRVGICVGDLPAVLDACLSSLGLAVLPTASTRHHVVTKALRHFGSVPLEAVPLFALRRPRIERDRAQVVIEALSEALRSFSDDARGS